MRVWLQLWLKSSRFAPLSFLKRLKSDFHSRTEDSSNRFRAFSFPLAQIHLKGSNSLFTFLHLWTLFFGCIPNFL